MGKHLKNIILFLAIFIILNSIFSSIWGPQTEKEVTSGNFIVETTDSEYHRNNTVKLQLKNETDQKVTLQNDCPGEPFNVFKYENGDWLEKTATPEIECSSEGKLEIAPGESIEVSYEDWNYALFGELGRFQIKIAAELNGEEKTFESNEFRVTEESFFGMIWMSLFFQPVYNVLVYFISIMPGHNLGLAIILLTILIRTILLGPSHKALKSQRKLQEVQPKIEEIKEKYAGDQQKIAQETMQLWKTQKVSPFGSCLPLLIQFPILIALFYAVQSGLHPDSSFILYEPLKGFDFTQINTLFLGILELTKLNLFVLPLLIGGLQFFQIKLSMSRKKKSNKKGKNKEMQMATNMMMYFMPVMIAVFTASLPAAVGLYWGTSTSYGIIQQLYINRESGGSNGKNSPEVKVKVIDKN